MNLLKLRIAIDMDGVLANNAQHYLDYYYQETGTRLDAAAIKGRPELTYFSDPTAVERFVRTPGFFRTLPVHEGAVEVVRQLSLSFEVFVVSAAMEYPNSLPEKFEWLQAHFPFISWRNIVFCGNKHVIAADYMIDDHLKNLQGFNGTGLLFDAPHNCSATGYERLTCWADAANWFQNVAASGAPR